MTSDSKPRKNSPRYRVWLKKTYGPARIRANALQLSETLIFLLISDFGLDASRARNMLRQMNKLREEEKRPYPRFLSREGQLINCKPSLEYIIHDSRFNWCTTDVVSEINFKGQLESAHRTGVDFSDHTVRLAFNPLIEKLQRSNVHNNNDLAANYFYFEFRFELEPAYLFYVEKYMAPLSEPFYLKGVLVTETERLSWTPAIFHNRTFKLHRTPYQYYKEAALPY